MILKQNAHWILLGVAVLLTATLLVQLRHTSSLARIKASYTSLDRAILDRHGLVIDEIRVEKHLRHLNWVSLEQAPASFVEALLVAEDKRFYYHPGFDPFSWGNTISMQLSDFIEHSARDRRGISVGVLHKLSLIGRALVLEIAWNKHDILEAYMNLVAYRGELQGIAAASFALFDKKPSALSRSEAAVVAAMIRFPNASMARVRARACGLLAKMGTPEECGLLTSAHLAYVDRGFHIRPYIRMAPQVAQVLATMPEIARDGLVRSTLDRQIQWVAMNALHKQISDQQGRKSNEGAVIVIENATGNVLAYVGDGGAISSAKSVDAVLLERQAGSTLKPLIYGKAIDERVLTSATVLENSPLELSSARSHSRTSGFSRSVRDLVTVRTALASSLDIPALRAMELLGVDNFVRTMIDFGFTGLQRPDFYGPSLALGSANVRLLELANAYRALANGGMWSPLRFSPDKMSEVAPRRVLSVQASFIVNDMLAERKNPAVAYWTAIQNGVSKDQRDNWCVGYSDKYTVGVWSASGAQAATPIWQEIMGELHRQESGHTPIAPEGLVRVQNEWFLLGTEPTSELAPLKSAMRSHISYPLNQSMIALDSENPSAKRMFIQIIAPRADQNIYLNGRRLGRAQAFLPWEPLSGIYTLELRDSKGQVVDRIHFEVRGRSFAMVN